MITESVDTKYFVTGNLRNTNLVKTNIKKNMSLLNQQGTLEFFCDLLAMLHDVSPLSWELLFLNVGTLK
jgi:hypothetical protein